MTSEAVANESTPVEGSEVTPVVDNGFSEEQEPELPVSEGATDTAEELTSPEIAPEEQSSTELPTDPEEGDQSLGMPQPSNDETGETLPNAEAPHDDNETVTADRDPEQVVDGRAEFAADPLEEVAGDPDLVGDAVASNAASPLSGDVRGDERELEQSNVPLAQEGPTLGVPGDVVEASVPGDSADHPPESAEAHLPVSEPTDERDDFHLPLPNDPIADAWGPDASTSAPPAVAEDRPGGTYRDMRQPFELPAGFLDGIGESLEPQFEQLRSAVQMRTAAVIEDQSILAELGRSPE